jgi:gliding motility-associated-like protein
MLRKLLLLLLLAGFSFVTAKAASITASFTVSPATSLCQDSTFTFKNTSSYTGSGTVTYKWYFGDNITSTATSPTHTYSSSGTFTVKLVATTTDAGKDSITAKVTVNAAPVADFKLFYGSKICQNYEVGFINESKISSGSITSYYWDLGNGRKSTNQNPTVSYSDTGTYTVLLAVVSDNGCRDTVRKQFFVQPRPKIAVTKIEHCVDSLSYIDASKTSQIGIVTNFTWSFDDSTADITGSSQSSITHAFKYPGRHVVKLITTGQYGCDDTALISVTVYDKPKPVISWRNTCVDSVFTFYDQSTVSLGRIVFWKWDFGDGTNAAYTERKDTLQHIYNTAGSYTVKLTLQSAQGCTTNATFVVDVRELPKAKFTTKKTCQDTAMQFIDISTVTGSSIVQWLWDFADTVTGTVNASTVQNPSHYYKYPGTYKVKLITWSAYGCKDSAIQDVIVLPKPIADFSFVNNCQDSFIVFSDASTVDNSSIVAWNWDFGDGSAPATTQNPSHPYTSSGTYTVRLVAWAKTGCNDTITKKVTIYPLPVPDFTISADCSRDTLIFVDKSTISSGTIFSRGWNFGDGNSANGTTVKNAFANPGTYNVKLTVISDNGCPVSVVKKIVIKPRPRASFDYFSACIGRNTTFADKSTVDTPNTINGWLWSFGDGSAPASGQIVTHKYAKSGIFIVRLVVFTTGGCTDTLRQVVNITPTPVAAFKAKDNCLDSAIQFTDESTVSAGGIVDWQWDFGDSTPIVTSNKTPIHKFNKTGTFDVKLVVVTDNGCRDSVIHSIIVYPQPEAGFIYTTHCADSAVTFTDTTRIASGNVAAWFWDFGDGSTSTDQNPQHKFFKGGKYTVILTAFSDQKCQSRQMQDVTVFPLPVVDFQALTACTNSTSTFYDNTQSSDPIIQRIWFFGDGDTASAEIAKHVYKDSGFYNVTLLERTSKGCVDSLVKRIYINPLPIVQFGWKGHCVGDKVEFTDSSYVPNGKITGWNWKYGDGGTENTSVPFASHTYSDTGTYDVVLTVSANNKCSISKTVQVHIYPLPKTSFSNDTACFESVTRLTSTSTITEGTIDAFLWTFEDGSTAEGAEVFYTLAKSGNNIVTLTTVSDQGCTSTTQQNVYVDPKPTAAFTASPNPASILNPLVQFTDQSKNAVAWLWKFGDGFTSTDESPSHLYQDTGAYDALQIVTNNIGCTDTLRHVVIVHQDYTLYVPNVFTPNDDSFNSAWKPVGVGIHDYTLKVYDRWGQIVFETTDFEEAWNGRYLNKGQRVPDGAYKYIISVIDYSQQKVKKITGFVTVLK